MDKILQAFFELSQVGLGLSTGLEIFGKAVAILGATLLLTVALQRASAAVRHYLWALALLSVLCLPIFVVLLPTWNVPMFSVVQGAMPVGAEASEAPGFSPVGAVAAASLPAASERSVGSADAWRGDRPERRVATGGDWPALLIMIWAAGSVLVLAPMLTGLLGVRRLVGRATPVTDPGWTRLQRQLAARLELDEPVVLLSSDRVSVPVTWGLRRPVVLLPGDAAGWGAEQRSAVLLHELNHVKRRDCLLQLLAHLACSIYWPNPLVWLAAHRMRVEREHACDDEVLASGTRASNYAGYLLEAARGVGVCPLLAVGMAQRSQLDDRLSAILDPRPRRRGLSRAAAGLVFASMLCLVLPTATLKVWAMGAKPWSHTQRLEESVEVRENGTLHLSSDLSEPGSVEVIPWDEPEVRLVVEKRVQADSESEAQRLFAQVDASIRQQGDELFVEPEGTSEAVLRVTYEVRVPRRFNLELELRQGSLDIGDIHGNVRAVTGAGNITVGQVVDGSVRLATAGGRLRLAGVERGDAELSSEGGPVDVGEVSGRLVVSTRGGKIDIARTGSETIAKTGGGDIRIDEARGSVELETGAGELEARLSSSDPPTRCVLRNGLGDVTVHVPENLAATIETSIDIYQEKEGREKEGRLGDPSLKGHRVFSDFPLSGLDPKVVADDEMKRISRFVSRGDVNGGGAVIQLSTTNADIHLKRSGS